VVQWQAKVVVAASSPLVEEPPKARLEAFIKAMRKAPVMLGPMPKVAARAGTKINEANTSPVPKAREPVLLFCAVSAI